MKKVITVNSNDPLNRSARLTIQATVDVEFGLDPLFVSFGRVSSKDIGKSQLVTIISKEIEKLVITKIEAKDAYVKAEYVPASKEKKEPQLKVTLVSLPPQQGNFRSQIIVYSNREKAPPATLNVNGFVAGPVTVSPERLNFRLSDDQSGVMQTVKVSDPEKKDFKVLEARIVENPYPLQSRPTGSPVSYIEPSKDDLKITIRAKEADGSIPVDVTFLRKLKANERVNGKFILKTNEPEQNEVEVQYYAFAQIHRAMNRERVYFRVSEKERFPDRTLILGTGYMQGFKILSKHFEGKPAQNPAGRRAEQFLEPAETDVDIKIGLETADPNTNRIPVTFTFKRKLKQGEQLRGTWKLVTNDPRLKEIFIDYYANYQQSVRTN